MKSLEFEVPLPSPELSSNGAHGHWSQVSRARAAYRRDVALLAASAARRAGWAAPPRARVSLVWGTGRALLGRDGLYRPRDTSNAVGAWKAGYDGLRDGGVIHDDSQRHMELGECRIDPTLSPGVRVTIERCEEGER